MKEMNILQKNFFRILRSGAFNDNEAIEPMSPFKWRRLFQMVEAQGVISVFALGVNNHTQDEGLNLPPDLIDSVKKKLEENDNRPKPFTKDEIKMTNRILNHKLRTLIKKEINDIDSSMETVDLLEIIIFNVNHMLTAGISLDGIIRLGRYLRIRGDKVDFVKLDQWLEHIHLERMAQLQGSILISVFGFEQNELPFVHKFEPEAFGLTIRSISNLAKDTAEEWNFRQSKSGFVKNNPTVLRRNVRRSVRYFSYAPLETTSSFLTNLGKSLSEIEE